MKNIALCVVLIGFLTACSDKGTDHPKAEVSVNVDSGDAGDKAKEALHNAGQEIKEGAEKTKEKLQEAGEAVKDKAQDIKEDLTNDHKAEVKVKVDKD